MLTLGPYISYWLEKTPRRLLHSLSYYRFAASLIGEDKRVLEVGCNEGLGTHFLSHECGFAKGVDFDENAINTAKSNWEDPHTIFTTQDALTMQEEAFDAVVSFDVIEHIHPENAPTFLSSIAGSLKRSGLAVIGTPSLISQNYASEVSRQGHINCYEGEKLSEAMQEHFYHVLMFSAHDEVIHTGFLPLAHYLIAIGIAPKEK